VPLLQSPMLFYDGATFFRENATCRVFKNSLFLWKRCIVSGISSESGDDVMGMKQTDTSSSIQQKSRLSTKRNAQWDKMLSELIEYREKYGDTLVPVEFADNPQLGSWVDTQRQNYKLYMQGKKSSLNEERIQSLEKEGMVWDVHDLLWEKRYQELVEYKNKFGDCNPSHSGEYSELWSWVFVQRRMYSLKLAGRNSSMSDKRIEALESIGFIFNLHEDVWNKRFNELKEYRSIYGDCLVPKLFPSNPALAKWVDQQRTQYKHLQDGRHSHLSPDRMQQLEDIGFVWNVHRHKWNIKYDELQSFYELNGHTNVPKKGNNKPLVRWIKRQRNEFEKYLNGEKSQMDEERIQLLRRAGLVMSKQ